MKLQALTELRKGMLKALPRKPKATGKKPLGAEGRREGSVMAQEGRLEGSKAAVHRKAPALTPWRVGSWALGAGLALYPWGLSAVECSGVEYSGVQWSAVECSG